MKASELLDDTIFRISTCLAMLHRMPDRLVKFVGG